MNRLYLGDMQLTYIEEWLKTRPQSDFIAQGILKDIQAERNRKKTIAECKHEYGSYIGTRECCTKCGTHDIGMGEGWTLDKLLHTKGK